MPQEISDILSSRSKTRVLEKLYAHRLPISLRQIARFCGLSLRPTEVAVKDLHAQRLLRRRDKDGKSFYSLNVDHGLYAALAALFESYAALKLQERAKSYSRSAQSALEFADSSYELLSTARRNRQ